MSTNETKAAVFNPWKPIALLARKSGDRKWIAIALPRALAFAKKGGTS